MSTSQESSQPSMMIIDNNNNSNNNNPGQQIYQQPIPSAYLPWSVQIPPSLQHRCSSPMAEDEVMGAYLLSSLNTKAIQTCANCGNADTPLWRKGWYDTLLSKHVMLCNACGLKYAKNQYCPYCKYVYKMNQDVHAQREQWLNCTQCRRWVHSECERKYGAKFQSMNNNIPTNTVPLQNLNFAQPAVPQVINQSSHNWPGQSQGRNFPYLCPDCKREGGNAMNIVHVNSNMN